MTSLIQKMNKYADDAEDYQRSKIELLTNVDTKLRNQACQVLAINIDSRIPDEQVRAKAFEVVPQADFTDSSWMILKSPIWIGIFIAGNTTHNKP